MAKIITIAQQKGGGGKTTLAAMLSVALMQTGHRVALLDIDPQGSLTQWHNLREEKYGKGFTGLSFMSTSGWRLGSAISQAKNKYDFIIIDSPPHTDTESKAAIRMADIVLIPMQPSPTDLWATRSTLDFALQEKKLVKIVLNRYNPSSKIGREVIAGLDHVMENYLGNRVVFSGCFMQGAGVTEIEPSSQGSLEVKQLTNEILSLLNVPATSDSAALVEA